MSRLSTAPPALALAFVLLGCPGKDESTGEEPSAQAQAPAAEPPAPSLGEYTFVKSLELDYGSPLLGLDLNARRAWTISRRQTLRRWDLDTGELVGEFPGATHSPMLSYDGSHVIAWSEGEIRVFDSTHDAPLARWEAQAKAVAISRDNRSLVTLAPANANSRESEIRVWETATGKALHTWTTPQPPEGLPRRSSSTPRYGRLELGAGGTRLLSWLPGWGSRVLVWSLPEGEQLAAFDHVLANSASYLAVDGDADTCVVHQLEDGQELLSARGECVTFSHDERHLLTREGNTWRRYALASKALAGKLELDGDASNPVFAPDGSALILSGAERPTEVWDFDEPSRPRIELGRAESYSFGSDSRFIWSITRDESALHGHDRQTGENFARLPPMQILGATQDALFTWSDRMLTRWALPSAEQVWETRVRVFAHEGQLSPSGELLAAWQRGELALVSMDEGARLKFCEVPPEADNLRWVDAEHLELLGESGYRVLDQPLINPHTCERSPGPSQAPPPAHKFLLIDGERSIEPELPPRYQTLDLKLDPKLQPWLIPSPNERWALLIHTKRADDLQTLELYDVASGKRRWAAGTRNDSVLDGRLVSFAWHPQGDALVVTTDAGGWVLDAKSGSSQALEGSEDTYALREAAFSANGRQLLLNDGGVRVLVYSL